MIITSFYKQQSSKSEVLEDRAMAEAMPGGLNGAPRKRKEEIWEWTAWCEDSLRCTGRNSCPSWSAFGRDGNASQGTKEKMSHIKNPVNQHSRKDTCRRQLTWNPAFGYALP